MKRFLFFTSLSFLFLASNSQVKEDKDPCDDVDVSKRFEGEAYTNSKAWINHLEKKSQLPDSIEAKVPPGTYIVSVRFLIDTNGNIGHVQILSDPGYGLAKGATEVLRKGPKWTPGIQNGQKVRSYRTQPITFVLTDE